MCSSRRQAAGTWRPGCQAHNRGGAPHRAFAVCASFLRFQRLPFRFLLSDRLQQPFAHPLAEAHALQEDISAAVRRRVLPVPNLPLAQVCAQDGPRSNRRALFLV